MAERKGKKDGGGGAIGGQGASSIFASPEDSIVAGEVLLKLTEDGVASVTANVPTGPLRATASLAPSGLGVSAVDEILSEAGAYAVIRLHPPMPPTMAMSAEAAALGSTYRVFIGADQDAEAVAARLQALDEVEDAGVNRWRETYATPNDPDFPAQWGLTKINCPAAWDRTTGNASITVAVVDTGIDLDHPELAPLLVPGRDLVDLPGGSAPPGFHLDGDFVGRDDVPQDEVGHGTHVAGTIACSSNNGVGVAGVTWSCRLMPVRVLARIVNNANAADVRGSGSAADIAAGIRWAVDHGARVINMSLGGPSDTSVERDAVAYAVAHNVVVVAAMGNDFQRGNPTSFPAAYPNVIAVGATTQSDGRAPFSNTGPHIDVAAPGVDVRSTVWNDGFTSMSGTSMASPHVAGVAALLLSCNPSQTAAQVGDVIRGTARALRVNAGDPVPNDQFGFGLVDAAAAVDQACPPVKSRQVICQSVGIACVPSVIVDCPPVKSRQIICQSASVTCIPSAIVDCPSVQIRCGQLTAVVRCNTTTPQCFAPTKQLTCLKVTRDPRCQISGSAACVPRIPDPGGQQGGEDLYDYDPYGAQATGGGAAIGPVLRLSFTIMCMPSVTIGCWPTRFVTCRRSFYLPQCLPDTRFCNIEGPGPHIPGPGPFDADAAGAGNDPYEGDPYGEWGGGEGDLGY